MNLLTDLKKLKGVITPDFSKSAAIRYIIIASQINARTILKNITFGDDVKNLIKSLKIAGIKIITKKNSVVIFGDRFLKNNKIFYCGDGASVFRFLTFVLLDKFKNIRISGSQKLLERPIDELLKLFKNENIFVNFENNIYNFKGEIKNKIVEVSANKTSQFASGVALSIPFSKNIDALKIIDKFTSISYFLYTLDILKEFGISYKIENNTYYISKYNQIKVGYILDNEIDYSNLSFYLFLTLNKNVLVNAKINKSSQPDYKMIELLNKFGFGIICKNNMCKLIKDNSYNNIEVNLCDNPDLLMPFLILGIYLNIDIKYMLPTNLNYKESARLDNLINLLSIVRQNYTFEKKHFILKIKKTENRNFKNLLLDAKSDHRLIMSYIILSYLTNEKIKIKNFDKISKSSPDFIKKLKKLGARFKCVKN